MLTAEAVQTRHRAVGRQRAKLVQNQRSAVNRIERSKCASIVQWQLACNNLLHGPEAGAQSIKTSDPSSLRFSARARAHGRSHRPLQPTSDRSLRSRSAPGFAGWRCLTTTSWFTNRPSVLPGDGLAPRARTSCSVGRCLHSCRTPFGLRPSCGWFGQPSRRPRGRTARSSWERADVLRPQAPGLFQSPEGLRPSALFEIAKVSDRSVSGHLRWRPWFGLPPAGLRVGSHCHHRSGLSRRMARCAQRSLTAQAFCALFEDRGSMR